MIQVNNLIQHAFQKCSLVGEYQVADGTKTKNALEDLKSVISKLNEQNLMLQDVKTLDSWTSDIIRIAKKPKNWFEYQKYEDIVLENRNVGDIIHIIEPYNGFNFYSVACYTPEVKELVSTVQFNNDMKNKYWPTHFIEEVPDRVIGVGRFIANRFVQLFPVDKMRMDSRPKVGLASEYFVKTENCTVYPIDCPEEANTVSYLYIELNAKMPSKIRVTYLENIPDLKIEDTLYINSMYETVLEEGLCAELCLRYKLMELKPAFDEEFSNSVRMLKTTNAANRPMTYDFSDNGSYMDNYYNGFAPTQW